MPNRVRTDTSRDTRPSRQQWTELAQELALLRPNYDSLTSADVALLLAALASIRLRRKVVETVQGGGRRVGRPVLRVVR